MSKNINDLFAKDLNKRERACFESGIKLGALYHILCGIPISSDDNIISSIEKGIESAISCQPYVKNVKIRLNKNKIMKNKSHEFDYDEITGKIIEAELTLSFESIEILAKIEWIEHLDYPLMYIEKIIENQS
ncbi:MAG: dihydroneopterin aldolase family protein [Candidatus Lokiarchaeota archaeon]|nr:dihydroneopterin aldolase family protein [Candidatus Lokiarchaeota archaeon]